MRKKALKLINLALSVFISLSCLTGFRPINADADYDSGKRDLVLVALGDSYSAGEGIEPFFGQSNKGKYTDPDWVAHRSEKAWSGQLMLYTDIGGCVPMNENRNKNWFFVADSGAEVTHLYNKRTKTVLLRTALSTSMKYKDSKKETTLPRQLDVFKTLENKGLKADYVTMTMGGNDMGFADVVKDALIWGRLNPNHFRDKLDERCEKLDSVIDNLKNSYVNISEEAGNQATIIIAGYPELMNPNGSAAFPKNNAQYVNQKIREFNSKIKTATDKLRDEKGIDIYFVSVDEEGLFRGHEAYTDDPYLNGIMFQKKEDIDQLSPVSAYSMHPNEKGAETYATAVQKVIDECEKHRAELKEQFILQDKISQKQAEIYKPILNDFVQENGMPKMEDEWFQGSFCRIIDFNKDGVPELYLASYTSGSVIYTIQNGKAVKIYEYSGLGTTDDGSAVYYDTEKKQYGIMENLYVFNGWIFRKKLFDGKRFNIKETYYWEFDEPLFADEDVLAQNGVEDYIVIDSTYSNILLQDMLCEDSIAETLYDNNNQNSLGFINFGYGVMASSMNCTDSTNNYLCEATMNAYNTIMN